jgi:type IX secretion system PorP/SprF family membrane protein
MKKILIILTLLYSFTGVKGQYELQFNQLIKSLEFINPGYNAVHGNVTGNLIYSNQWNGFPGSPTTAGASFHFPLKFKHIGFGALFLNEGIGHRELRTGGLTIDTDIRIGSSSYITMGIMGGFQINDYNLENATTSYLETLNDIYNYNSTIVGTGFNLFTGNLHLGFSGYYHITPLEVENDFMTDLTLYSNASYWFRLDDAWRLKLSGLYKSRGNYASIAEAGMSFLLKDIAWLGVSYRLSSAAIISTDVRISSFLRIGYSFAVGMGKLANFTGNSHEIMLHVSLPERTKTRIADVK